MSETIEDSYLQILITLTAKFTYLVLSEIVIGLEKEFIWLSETFQHWLPY